MCDRLQLRSAWSVFFFQGPSRASEGWTWLKLPSATIIAPAVLHQTWNWIIRRRCVTYVTVCVYMCVCLFVYISISIINVVLDKVNDICCFVFYRAHFSYWLFCDSHEVLTSLCTLPAVVGTINKNIWCHIVATMLPPSWHQRLQFVVTKLPPQCHPSEFAMYNVPSCWHRLCNLLSASAPSLVDIVMKSNIWWTARKLHKRTQQSWPIWCEVFSLLFAPGAMEPW